MKKEKTYNDEEFILRNLNNKILEITPTGKDLIGRIKIKEQSQEEKEKEYIYFKNDSGTDILFQKYLKQAIYGNITIPSSFCHFKHEVVYDKSGFAIKIIDKKNCHPVNKNYHNIDILACIGTPFKGPNFEMHNFLDELEARLDYKKLDENNEDESCGTVGCRMFMYYEDPNGNHSKYIKVFKNMENTDLAYYIPMLNHGPKSIVEYKKINTFPLLQTWLLKAYNNFNSGIAVDVDSSHLKKRDIGPVTIYYYDSLLVYVNEDCFLT